MKMPNQLIATNQAGSRLGVRGRMFIGFAAIALILGISIGLILIKLTEAKKFAEHVVSYDYPATTAAYDLDIQLHVALNANQAWILTENSDFKKEFNRAWNNIENIFPILDDYAKQSRNSVYEKHWQDVKQLILELKTIQGDIQHSTELKTQKTLYQTKEYPLSKKIFDLLDGPLGANGERSGGLFELQLTQYQKSSQQIIQNMSDIRLIEFILLGATLLLCIGIAWHTAKGLLSYVSTFRKQSNRIATGDLTQRIVISSDDELGQLGEDLNTMTESLAGITRQITEGCQHIVTTLEEVKHAVDAQSSGASEQASSINQITASLSEIEKSSNQTIEKTKALGETAMRTQEKGELGLEAVEQSILGMKAVREKVQMIAQTILELSNKTQQIGEITAVVNSLAQQSKMLALNASIEAAKAGEAGKGFAVVAEEVKNLAEQSEQSTSQVQKIIEDIRHATEKAVMATEEGTKGVDQGTGLVEQTGDVVRSLSEVIHEATLATQQIEAAVRQESVGIEQITAGMNEINQVTSTFVESVKQTTEAVSHLSGIAKDLKENVDVYKV